MAIREGAGRTRVAAVIVAGVALTGLAGCAGSLGGGGGIAKLFGAQTLTPPPIGAPPAPEVTTPILTCPLIEIRPGTESLQVFERGGDGDASRLRYQAAVSDTARECLEVPGGVGIRIGVTGALVGGPKASGSATSPLRVAVLDSTERVIFSQVYNVGGNIGAPAYRAEFAQVVEGIVIPGTGVGAKIYVGFDAQRR